MRQVIWIALWRYLFLLLTTEGLYGDSLRFDYSIIDALNQIRLISLGMIFQYEIKVYNQSVKKL